MGNGRTSINVHKDRLISKTKDTVVMWMTPRNILKFKEIKWVNIYFGNMGKEWVKYGRFEMVKQFTGTKQERGLVFFKCKLRKMSKEKEEMGL